MTYRPPPPTGRVRASDQERNEAILALGDHHAEGRLDLAEFTSRMEQAQQVTYLDELDPLFADLPLRRPPTPAVQPGRSRIPARAGRNALRHVVVVAMVVVAFAAMVKLTFLPLWLMLGLWYFWGFGARAERRPQWRYRQEQHHPAPEVPLRSPR